MLQNPPGSGLAELGPRRMNFWFWLSPPDFSRPPAYAVITPACSGSSHLDRNQRASGPSSITACPLPPGLSMSQAHPPTIHQWSTHLDFSHPIESRVVLKQGWGWGCRAGARDMCSGWQSVARWVPGCSRGVHGYLSLFLDTVSGPSQSGPSPIDRHMTAGARMVYSRELPTAPVSIMISLFSLYVGCPAAPRSTQPNLASQPGALHMSFGWNHRWIVS